MKINEFLKIYDNYADMIKNIEGIDSDNGEFDDWAVLEGVSQREKNANIDSLDEHIITKVEQATYPYKKLRCYFLLFSELYEMYGLEVARNCMNAIWSGWLYLHDADKIYLPYCWATDAVKLANKGLNLWGTISSKPAKHALSFANHVASYIWYASNNLAGAIAVPNFIPVLSYYIAKDEEDGISITKDIEQLFQTFVYFLNYPSRQSSQSPYTNIALYDREYLDFLFKGVEINGKEMDDKDVDWAMHIQKEFIKWFVKEFHKTKLTFPDITVMLLTDDGKIKDTEFLEYVIRHDSEFGVFKYFVSDNAYKISSCCRLTSDIKKCNSELGFQNSFGVSNIDVGSHRVCTLNLVRWALDGGKEWRLYEMIERSICILSAHRNIMKRYIDEGLLPLYKEGYMDLDSQYSTVGIIGMYDAIKVLDKNKGEYVYREGMYSKAGREVVNDVLDKIEKYVDDVVYEGLINIEQVPGETAAYKLRQKDEFYYPGFGDLYGINSLYSNQWYPIDVEIPVLERLETALDYDNKLSGGAILHLHIDKMTEERKIGLVDYIAAGGGGYFAFNHKIALCTNGHVFTQKRCPSCGCLPVDYLSRIVGYFVPLSGWNEHKRKEYEGRQVYEE